MAASAGMIEDGDQFTRGFRQEAISVQTAFSAMRPLVFKSQILSCNAEITSAHLGESGLSFGIIARELLTMVRALEELIEELQTIFKEVAAETAQWIQAECRRELFGRGMTIIEGIVQSGSENGTGDDRLKRLGVMLEANNETNLEGMHTSIRNVIDLSKRINKYIDRISWVAVRQSHFTAITARVEAAKMNDGEADISSVASAIPQLAEEIAQTEQKARDKILRLNGLAGQLGKRIRGNGRAVKSA